MSSSRSASKSSQQTLISPPYILLYSTLFSCENEPPSSSEPLFHPRNSVRSAFAQNFLRPGGLESTCSSSTPKQDSRVTPLTSHTCKLTPPQAKSLEVYLRDHDF